MRMPGSGRLDAGNMPQPENARISSQNYFDYISAAIEGRYHQRC